MPQSDKRVDVTVVLAVGGFVVGLAQLAISLIGLAQDFYGPSPADPGFLYVLRGTLTDHLSFIAILTISLSIGAWFWGRAIVGVQRESRWFPLFRFAVFLSSALLGLVVMFAIVLTGYAGVMRIIDGKEEIAFSLEQPECIELIGSQSVSPAPLVNSSFLVSLDALGHLKIGPDVFDKCSTVIVTLEAAYINIVDLHIGGGRPNAKVDLDVIHLRMSEDYRFSEVVSMSELADGEQTLNVEIRCPMTAMFDPVAILEIGTVHTLISKLIDGGPIRCDLVTYWAIQCDERPPIKCEHTVTIDCVTPIQKDIS